MKILLQTEAKTISNYELAENQKYLINLLNKFFSFGFRLQSKSKASKSCNES